VRVDFSLPASLIIIEPPVILATNTLKQFSAQILGAAPSVRLIFSACDTPHASFPELSIFSTHYRTEISSIDVETGRIDRFGEGASYPSRAILLYSGIHYDATSLAPTPGAPLDFHETLFPVGDKGVLAAAQTLAGKLREQKKFTNTATFLLKCEVRLQSSWIFRCSRCRARGLLC
jgi:hypothetical protein